MATLVVNAGADVNTKSVSDVHKDFKKGALHLFSSLITSEQDVGLNTTVKLNTHLFPRRNTFAILGKICNWILDESWMNRLIV